MHKPLTMLDGFLLVGGLVAVGLLLQWALGPVVWDAFAFPVNALVLTAFVATIVTVHALRRRVRLFRFLATGGAAVPALVAVVALTIVMGLTRQDAHGTGTAHMTAFWPFVLVYAYVALLLGLVVLRRLADRLAGRSHHSRWQDVAFLLNHVGLFLTMTTATLGNADIQRYQMITTLGQTEWRALDDQRRVRELPLAIRLDRFIMETYADGSPRRFASEIQILTREGRAYAATVDVNHPVKVAGWKIYQHGYDTQRGAESEISILQLVRDPWLPAVYTGIGMMLAGAACLFLFGARRKEKNAV